MIKLLANLFIKNNKNYKDNKVREQYTVLTGIFGIFLNIICSTFKIIVGVLTGSIAIVSDGLNNIADISSSVVSIFAAKLSNKRPDKDHPFGHGRVEYIGSLIVSFLIMFMGGELIIESFKKIINPTEVDFNIYVIIVLVISILVKLYMFFYNRIYSKKINSMVLKATSIDSLFDCITTTAILIASILGNYINFPFDGVAGCLVGLLICYGGLKIAIEAIATLLGVPPSKETIDEFSKIILSKKEILGIHDLIIHNYGPGRVFASVHAEIDEKSDIVKVHEIIDAVEVELLNKMNILTTIHMDPISTSKDTLKHKEIVSNAIKEIDGDLKLHDFRMVKGEKQINVIFDLVTPYHYKKEQVENIASIVQEKLKSIDKRYQSVIQVESEYL